MSVLHRFLAHLELRTLHDAKKYRREPVVVFRCVTHHRSERRHVGVFDASAGSVRSWVDSQTEHPGIDQGLDKANATLKAAVAAGEGTAKSAGSRAEALRGQIQEILSGS